MINLLIADAYNGLVKSEKLTQSAQAVLNKQLENPDVDLSVVVDDDARLRELNADFLGIDAPTDVLSFPSGEEEVDPETGRHYLGDIIISFPRAAEQSEAAGHSVMDEIQLLVVHGTLHLLGFDHADPDEKESMWSIQAEILRGLNVQLNRLPE